MSTRIGELARGAFATVLRGFLLGVGFTIAAGIGYYVMWQVAMSSMKETVSSDMGSSFGVPAKDLALSDVEEKTHEGASWIVGSVKNNGEKKARGVQVRADLFDHGKFVDQYSTYLSGSLEPGQSQRFKIACGCKDSPPAVHDSFKVEIATSY